MKVECLGVVSTGLQEKLRCWRCLVESLAHILQPGSGKSQRHCPSKGVIGSQGLIKEVWGYV